MEVIDVFKSGGPVMYALLLCSICTAVIMIERGMFYHRAGKNLGIFVDNLPDMLLNKSNDIMTSRRLRREMKERKNENIY